MTFLESFVVGAATFFAVSIDGIIAYHALIARTRHNRFAINAGIIVGTAILLMLANFAGSRFGSIPFSNEISSGVLLAIAGVVFFGSTRIVPKEEEVEEEVIEFELKHHVTHFFIGLSAYFLLSLDDGITYTMLFDRSNGNIGIALGVLLSTVLVLTFMRRTYRRLIRTRKFPLAMGTLLVFVATLKLLRVV
jgi:high-affinity Fe2+/Pb2+ permease